MLIEHAFTKKIKNILHDSFRENADDIFMHSPLLQYLNIKTKSATSGSKARSGFGNIYALYVVIENYIDIVYNSKIEYNFSE